ncbi:MAG TPA: WG repeat-containing protein [Leptospiraceae bacterium]|nr:WG repeat-containing protein [Leptospirales bacterium]HMU82428.1 WG repeat-containing protein [Leptospiraceae bacterium]HMW61559.1 WG repeat-containing protein [Leptospiraceae bacterium]HMX56186.1 WG repeat-containing protein [Leptospiraceae bacterium]HMY45559.1 WG repeat-containing protein [Leptospiraceae bacterium]
MKRILLLCLLLSSPLLAEKLQSFEKDNLFGFKNAAGKVVIPARFVMAGEFNAFGFATVIEGSKPYLIDAKGTRKFEMFMFDNGPDYFEEGKARYIEKGKMGFFDEQGRKVTPAAFDFAFPFEGGMAVICNGCKRQEEGEHYRMTGGKWTLIDKTGKMLTPAVFDSAPVMEGNALTGFVDGKKQTVKIRSDAKEAANCKIEARNIEPCNGKTIQVEGILSNKGQQHPRIALNEKESYWEVFGSDWILVSRDEIHCPGAILATGRLRTKVGPCDAKSSTKNMYCGTALYVDRWQCK